MATYSGTTTYFHNADWLGTERVRTDVNGNIYETCQGLPYGDGQECAGGEVTPMHFTGKQRDTETNLDDFPARYYSSVQGRWLTADWRTWGQTAPSPHCFPQRLGQFRLFPHFGALAGRES